MRIILYILFLVLFPTISLSFSGKGSGTKDDPYQITNVSQLQEIKDETDANYILMNDIDASETRYWNIGDHDNNPNTPNEPMGYQSTFLFGSINGNGNIIKNLYINRLLESSVALFSLASGHIFKLGLENCQIVGCDYVSSLCAYGSGGVIEECFTSGLIIAKCESYGNGGFCGITGGTDIKNCYTSCTVLVDTSEKDHSASSFCDCYMAENCYTIGKVISNKKGTVFGEFAKLFDCFWDIETTGIPDTGGLEAKGLSTSDMKKKATYVNAGWDFDSVWCIDEGKDYPKLRAFGKCPPTDVKQEPSKKNKLDAFPNPASTSIDVIFKLHREGTAQLIITNSYGQQVYNANVNNENGINEQKYSIDISSFPSGLYFVTLRSAAVTLTKRVVVVK